MKSSKLSPLLLISLILGALPALAEEKCAVPVFNSATAAMDARSACMDALREADRLAGETSVKVAKSCSHGSGTGTFNYSFDVIPQSPKGCGEFANRFGDATAANEKQNRVFARATRGVAYLGREAEDIAAPLNATSPTPARQSSGAGK